MLECKNHARKLSKVCCHATHRHLTVTENIHSLMSTHSVPLMKEYLYWLHGRITKVFNHSNKKRHHDKWYLQISVRKSV